MLTIINRRAVQVLTWWVLAVSRKPALTLSLLVPATIAAAVYVATHIAVNSDMSDMIGEDVPYKETFDQFNSQFPLQDNVILVVIDGTSPEYAQTAATALYRSISADKAAVEYTFWPAGDMFFRQNGLLYLETDELADIADQLAEAQPLLGQLAADPNLRGLASLVGGALDAIARGQAEAAGIARLLEPVSKSIEARLAGKPEAMSWRSLMAAGDKPNRARELLVVKPVQDFHALEPVAAALGRIRAAIAELPAPIGAQVKVRLTGEAMLAYEEIGSATRGIGAAAVLSLVLLAFILVWGLRSIWLAATGFLTIVVGLIWTAFFAVVAFEELNLISVAFAVLFVGLAEDFVIHFGLRVREGIDSGAQHLKALGDSAEGAGSALLFLALATATGFLAFVPTEYVGLAELGVIASMGMVIALVVTLTLMPALLSLRPLPQRPRRILDAAVTAESGLRHHAGLIVVLAGVAAVLAVLPLGRLYFDPDTFNLKDPGTESVTTLRELVADGDVAAYPVDYILKGEKRVPELAAKLAADPSVAKVTTIETYVPQDQEEKLAIIGDMALFMEPILNIAAAAPPAPADMRREIQATVEKIQKAIAGGALGDKAPVFATFAQDLTKLSAASDEDMRDADADIFRFFPLFLEQLERAMMAGPVSLDTLPPLLRRNWVTPDGFFRVEAVAKDDRGVGTVDVPAFVDSMQAIDPTATGPAVANVGAGRAVTDAMLKATIYAIFAIAVLLLVVLRDVVDTALTILPLVLSGLLTAATAAVLGIPMNFANIITLPLILGIGLAGCSHLLLRAREEGPNAKLWETSTPLATVIAAASTVTSFGSLTLSSHRGTQSMGILLAIAIFWSLVATLLVLPALLELHRRQKRPRTG
ncbi:MAG TPA: MMPL family transporter [Verrucomicrobiae bacterium]|nr:MMPL family transporter [Verrucomicrobiae bacterium]